MTIIYRSAGSWGAGKGAPLTWAELDGNFFDHEGRLTTVEGQISSPLVSIDYFVVENGMLYIHLTDHTVQGPFVLPAPLLQGKGVWAAETAYNVGDLFWYGIDLYISLLNHTSDVSFDPNRSIGGAAVYSYILTIPTVPIVTVATETFTPTLSHANRYMRCTHANGCAVTIPNNTTEPYPIGTEMHYKVAGGTVEFTAESPANLNGIDGLLFSAQTMGAVISLKKFDTNEWDIWGLLTPVSS